MKKFVVFLVLAAMVVLPACGDIAVYEDVSSTETVSVISSEAVTGPTVTVTATPAEGWTAVDSNLPVQYLKDTASILVSPNEINSALTEAVAQAKTEAGTTYFDIAYVGNDTTIQVDGREAITFTFTCKYSSIDMKYQYTFVKVGEFVYRIVFSDMMDVYDSNAADYTKFLAEVRFVEQA